MDVYYCKLTVWIPSDDENNYLVEQTEYLHKN